MANIKISNLPVAISVTGSDSFPVVQSGVTKQATKSVLLTDLGTPASLVLTNATGLPIDAGTINTLPVARGGTGVTTSTGSGNVVLSASPTLTGTTIVSALTASGNVTFDGGAFVFNESGADKDARFEGDTDANLLFLDASTDRVGIGTATPAAKLDVNGPASVTSFTGSTRLGVTVKGSTAATDYSGIDFSGNNQSTPTARIAVLSTANGSFLVFGTSIDYATGITNTALTIDFLGNLIYQVNGTAPTLSTNSTMSFELTSNTSLRIVVRGTDGTTRSVSLTLA